MLKSRILLKKISGKEFYIIIIEIVDEDCLPARCDFDLKLIRMGNV